MFDAEGQKDQKQTRTFLPELKILNSINIKLTKNRNINHTIIKFYVRRCKHLHCLSRATRTERLKVISYLKNKTYFLYFANEINQYWRGYELPEHDCDSSYGRSAFALVFAAVASNGRVIPFHFIDCGFKIQTLEHLEILKDVLLP